MPGVVIADLHVALRLFRAEIQHAAEVGVCVDIPDVHVVGDLEFPLERELAGDADGNDVLIAVFHQHVQRERVDKAAVGV